MENMQPKKVDLVIPMIARMEITATKTAEAVAQFMGLSDEKTAEVSMAIIEACINSFEHSKSNDSNVYITFSIDKSRLIIDIRDNGRGFDPSVVPVPDINDKLKGKRKRGWGMQLMKELMDEVTVTSDNNGTLLRLVKNK